VGVVSIFLTRQHQRLGDLAAGTIVVHDRENLTPSSSGTATRTFTAGVFEQTALSEHRRTGINLPASSLQLLGVADLEVLEGFFARRLDFSIETRALLAQRIAEGIRAKTDLDLPSEVSTETFLEEVAHRLRDLVRIR
jgi:hypothetical protein